KLRPLVVANRSILISLSVDLISANIYKPPNLTSDLAGLQEDLGAVDVVLGELKGVIKRIINMGLGVVTNQAVGDMGRNEACRSRYEYAFGFVHPKVMQCPSQQPENKYRQQMDREGEKKLTRDERESPPKCEAGDEKRNGGMRRGDEKGD
ncbi:hypothetical protein GW17_00050194, partial [Ensete ventricosum]